MTVLFGDFTDLLGDAVVGFVEIKSKDIRPARQGTGVIIDTPVRIPLESGAFTTGEIDPGIIVVTLFSGTGHGRVRESWEVHLPESGTMNLRDHVSEFMEYSPEVIGQAQAAATTAARYAGVAQAAADNVASAESRINTIVADGAAAVRQHVANEADAAEVSRQGAEAALAAAQAALGDTEAARDATAALKATVEVHEATVAGYVDDAGGHALAAAASASAASTSEGNASTSESNAANSATGAAASATAAAASEGNATAAATAASASESNASTSETNAANSATAASTSESNAAQSETGAAAHAAAAAQSATDAAAAESNAANSATGAAASATAAAASEGNAAASATSAETSATNAAQSETDAAGHAAQVSLDMASVSGMVTTVTDAKDIAVDAAGIAVSASVAASMYSGVGPPEGKQVASVGAVYVDTVATAGAVRWVKTHGTGNTGWQVMWGDTGIRDVAGIMHSGATVNKFHLRRTGDAVSCYIDATLNSISNGDTLFVFPSGFRTHTGMYMPPPAPGSYFPLVSWGGNGIMKILRSASSPDSVKWSATWTTPDIWPTTLPGAAY